MTEQITNMKFCGLLLALYLLAACSDDNDNTTRSPSWEKLGLDGKSVNEMQIVGDVLYTATTSGLYKKQLDSHAGFLLVGFDNKNVEAIEVVDDHVILVSLFDKSGAEGPLLTRSSDGGATWSTVDSNFGGEINEPIFDLELHPDNKNVLFATGYSVVARSETQGISWHPIYGDWGGFSTGISVVEVNPIGSKEIWAGGQGAIENGFLLRSEDEENWDVWNDLVENPTVVKEITFSDQSEAEVFVGFEGALLKTSDAGETWQTLIKSEENRFYFGIALQKENPDRVYAGGWLKTPDPQPLILFISNDGGVSWQEFNFPGESFGGILDMQIKSEPDEDVIYVGLDKGGVYRITVNTAL